VPLYCADNAAQVLMPILSVMSATMAIMFGATLPVEYLMVRRLTRARPSKQNKYRIIPQISEIKKSFLCATSFFLPAAFF
jgi:hypothetical protein